MLDWLWNLAVGACALVGAVSLVLYLVPLVIYSFWLPEQNLKRKYNADWGTAVRCYTQRKPFFARCQF